MSIRLQVSCVYKEQDLEKRTLEGQLRKIHHRGNVLSNVFPSAVYSYLMFQHSCLENRLNVVLFREAVFTGRWKLVLQPLVNL